MHKKIDDKLVSVIMPTYNRANLVMETIESIREQTYSHWELIIVDDGSTDNTRDIIASVDDSRIQYIQAGRIGIGGKIKNIGIEKARGGFLAFIDSDDLWAPGKLEQQVRALDQYPNSGFSLTNGYNFRQRCTPIDYFSKHRTGIRCSNIFIDLFSGQLAAFAQTLLLRRTCLDKTGLFKEEKSFSDLDFIISLASHYEAVLLYEPLTFRRLHDQNYITPNWEKSYEEGIDLIETNASRLPLTVANNALFRAYMDFGERSLGFGKRGKALSRFWKGWQYKRTSIAPLKKMGKVVISYMTTRSR